MFPQMFLRDSSDSPRVFLKYSLAVPWYSFGIPLVFLAYSLHVPYLLHGSVLGIPCVLLKGSVCTPLVFLKYPLGIPYVFGGVPCPFYLVWTWFSWLPLWFVTCYLTLVVFVPFHFISAGFQLFSTATLFNLMLWFVVIRVGTWRHNFIMDYEIMKLDVVHWSLNLVFLTATWFDTFNISYLSLLPLTVSHLGGNCSWLQL